MGFLKNIFRSKETANETTEVVDSLVGFFGFGKSLTTATSKSALTLSAFYNGVDQISNDIAKLPKNVFKKEGKLREKFTEHPVNILISQRPSGLMIAFDFWKILVLSVIIKGNGYVEIIRNKNTGQPQSLIFRNSDDVTVFKSGYELIYKYKGRLIDGSDMLHFKGFSFDGLMGIGVITFAAKQLGVSLASQVYAAEMYENKGLSFGVLETDKAITDVAQKKKLGSAFSERLSEKNPFRTAVLDEGMKYKPIAITPAEAQFLETNKAGLTEVARWLNIAPHKLKDLTNANYSNIYQQSIEHVQDSILPWVVRFQQEINNKLFSENELGTVYSKFNISILLQGDLDMKQRFYTSMAYAGIYTRNEIRALEDMNPIDGLDEPLQPVNMQAISQILENSKKDEDTNK